MLWNAKNGRLRIDDTVMDFVRFGNGPRRLLILPGLGDGLTTVRGKALPLAAGYRLFLKDYTVCVLSRRARLREGCTTRDMARDAARALRLLSFGPADVLGVSQGGMIAQHLAADYPAWVDRLALAVTAPRANDGLRDAVNHWIGLARRGARTALMTDTARRIYTPRRYRLYRPLLPLTAMLAPRDMTRFIIQAEACLAHDALARLSAIRCPTLVIGGGRDTVVGAAAAGELAAGIPRSALYVYEGLGHAAYEEARDFNRRVLAFLIGDR